MSWPAPNDIFAERYRLEAILGEGGFATVFKATDLGTERVVAIKVLKQHDGRYSQDIESRFAREIKVIAQLTAAHTVTLHDYGRTSDGLMFMIFEHVPGRDLSQVLVAEKRLAPSVVIHIMLQVLTSLSEAHARGLLHRDIKPENIRIYEHLGDPYHVKVLDFGLARPVYQAPASAITKQGELIGTPRYMSPEQLVDGELSPASDLYSLGLVALEMLTGSAKLQGNRWADQFDRLVTGHVFNIDEVQRIEPGLQAIVQKMTARAPADRYPNVDAVVRALEQLARRDSYDGPVPRPATTVIPPRPMRPTVSVPTRPRISLPPIAALAMLALLLVSLVGVGGWYIWSGAKQDKEREERERRIAVGEMIKKQAAQPTNASRRLSEAHIPQPDLGMAVLGGSSGCGKKVKLLSDGSLFRGHDPTARNLPLYVPTSYEPTEKHPLVLLFHQDARSSDDILKQTSFNELAEEKNFIVLAPDYHGSKFWVWRKHDDVKVIQNYVNEVSRKLCIDEARIYAVGHGSGGFAIENLSCEPWIAAVASNGFRSNKPEFPCDTPKPSLYMTPIHSKRMLKEGGTACSVDAQPISLEAQESKWLTRNQCSDSPQLFGKSENGVCRRYACTAPFVSCHIDGGYGWPGSQMQEWDATGDCQDELKDFPATETIWRFFDGLAG